MDTNGHEASLGRERFLTPADVRVGAGTVVSRCRAVFRALARSLWLGGELARALAGYAVLALRSGGRPTRAARARWLQRACRRVLRVLHVHLRVSGPVPGCGLLVSNHLGYLDILVFGAVAPCVFVSKHEVRHWPVFGWLAVLAGTLFVRRERRADAARLNGEMRRALDEGALVVLFPEGTSSDGRGVLPFKSSLLEAAAGQVHPVAAAHLQYTLDDGDPGEEVCYWKDMTLLPHLWNLLGKRGVGARLRLVPVEGVAAGRKELAHRLHAEVVRLQRLSIP